MRTLAFALLLLLGCFMTVRSEDEDRVAAARPRAEPILREKFKTAGVSYPAHEVFLRAFKREGVVELWARAKSDEAFRLIHSYAVTQASGVPGPKRMEGDLQVPEGFYEVDRFNPKSLFHLSLGLNYPNAADRILGHPVRPGQDIFIHGSNVSVGCLPVGDDAIEEIYIATLDSKAQPVPMHVFPAKMNAADWPAWRDEQIKAKPELGAFWAQLQPGFDAFEKMHLIPITRVANDGTYVVQAAR